MFHGHIFWRQKTRTHTKTTSNYSFARNFRQRCNFLCKCKCTRPHTVNGSLELSIELSIMCKCSNNNVHECVNRKYTYIVTNVQRGHFYCAHSSHLCVIICPKCTQCPNVLMYSLHISTFATDKIWRKFAQFSAAFERICAQRFLPKIWPFFASPSAC